MPASSLSVGADGGNTGPGNTSSTTFEDIARLDCHPTWDPCTAAMSCASRPMRTARHGATDHGGQCPNAHAPARAAEFKQARAGRCRAFHNTAAAGPWPDPRACVATGRDRALPPIKLARPGGRPSGFAIRQLQAGSVEDGARQSAARPLMLHMCLKSPRARRPAPLPSSPSQNSAW